MFFAGSPGLLLLFVCFLIALLYVLRRLSENKKISRSTILHPPQSIVSEIGFLFARAAGW